MLGDVSVIGVDQIGVQLPNGQINFVAALSVENKEDAAVILTRIWEDVLRPFAMEYCQRVDDDLYEINGHIITAIGYPFESYDQIQIRKYLEEIIS